MRFLLSMVIPAVRRCFFLFLGAMVFSGPDLVGESMLLTGATVHTVSGETIPAGKVLFQDGKIINVASRDTKINLTRGTRTVDLSALHVYPGMIALNTTMGLVEISGVRATRDVGEVGDFTPDVESWIAVNPDSELLPVARANGVAYFQPTPQGGMVAGQSGLIALNGWTTEEMAVKKIAALHIYWPSMGLNAEPKESFKDQSKWKSLEDQAKERTKKIRELDEFFSDARNYAQASGERQRIPAWEAMIPYVKGELPVMIHADEIRQIKGAVNWATTNKLKMILAGARDAWMAPEFLATNNVAVLFEHVFTQPVRDADAYDVHFKAAEVLRNAGVKLATGMGPTTFDAGLIKNLPYQAAQAVAFGFDKAEAVKSITLRPAEFLGVQDRIGSIEVGKEATFVVTDGDLLDIRSNVKRMWIAGKEISLESRHTRLYGKYRSRPQKNAP